MAHRLFQRAGVYCVGDHHCDQQRLHSQFEQSKRGRVGMTTTTANAPGATVQTPMEGVNYSTRVDKVGRRAQTVRLIRIIAVILVAIIGLIPIYWMGTTAFKTRADAVAIPPKI